MCIQQGPLLLYTFISFHFHPFTFHTRDLLLPSPLHCLTLILAATDNQQHHMSLTKAISNLSISLTNALGAKRGRPDGSSGILAFVKMKQYNQKFLCLTRHSSTLRVPTGLALAPLGPFRMDSLILGYLGMIGNYPDKIKVHFFIVSFCYQFSCL